MPETGHLSGDGESGTDPLWWGPVCPDISALCGEIVDPAAGPGLSDVLIVGANGLAITTCLPGLRWCTHGRIIVPNGGFNRWHKDILSLRSHTLLRPRPEWSTSIPVIATNGDVGYHAAGRCCAPSVMTFRGRYSDVLHPSARPGLLLTDPDPRMPRREMAVHYLVPCRTCAACSQARARGFALRCMVEFDRNPMARTWVVVSTLRPQAWNEYRAKALELFARRPEGLTDDDTNPRWRECCHNALAPELALARKRLRKNYGYPFAWVRVLECTQRGVPHFHWLIHEAGEGLRMPYRQVRSAWHLGNSDVSLADGSARPIGYLLKYMSKGDGNFRLRRSNNYGLVEPEPFEVLGDGRLFEHDPIEYRAEYGH